MIAKVLSNIEIPGLKAIQKYCHDSLDCIQEKYQIIYNLIKEKCIIIVTLSSSSSSWWYASNEITYSLF